MIRDSLCYQKVTGSRSGKRCQSLLPQQLSRHCAHSCNSPCVLSARCSEGAWLPRNTKDSKEAARGIGCENAFCRCRALRRQVGKGPDLQGGRSASSSLLLCCRCQSWQISSLWGVEPTSRTVTSSEEQRLGLPVQKSRELLA